MKLLEKMGLIIKSIRNPQKKLEKATNVINKDIEETNSSHISLADQISMVKNEYIPKEVSLAYPEKKILPFYSGKEINSYTKNGGHGNLTYLVKEVSKMSDLSCYNMILFSKLDSKVKINKLYTIYSEGIDENALKEDRHYFNAVKEILLSSNRLHRKSKIAEEYGLKNTCYVGHLEKERQNSNIPYSKDSYVPVAHQGESEKAILAELAKLLIKEKSEEQKIDEEFKKVVSVQQRPGCILNREEDVVRIQELNSDIEGLKKYLMANQNGMVRTFYSEGIQFDLLKEPEYKQKIRELLSESRLKQKEEMAKIYGVTSTCYVGTILPDDNGRLVRKAQQGKDEKEIYDTLKKYETNKEARSSGRSSK